MLLHQVKPKNKNKRKKPRVGRGGKRGTYSGKGQKGQKSRSGRKIRPAIYDLLSRLPKLRGSGNKPTKKELVFNVSALEKMGENVFNKDVFLKKGLLKKTGRIDIKILGDGEIKKAVTIQGIKVSKGARLKIEKAGGKII